MTEYEMKRALTLIWKHMVSGLFCWCRALRDRTVGLRARLSGWDCRLLGGQYEKQVMEGCTVRPGVDVGMSLQTCLGGQYEKQVMGTCTVRTGGGVGMSLQTCLGGQYEKQVMEGCTVRPPLQPA